PYAPTHSRPTAVAAARRISARCMPVSAPARKPRQRPWHFLYLRPEPQKHTSLRPIRRPSGATPGRRPPDPFDPWPDPITWSPSDSLTARTAGGGGRPRAIEPRIALPVAPSRAAWPRAAADPGAPDTGRAPPEAT